MCDPYSKLRSVGLHCVHSYIDSRLCCSCDIHVQSLRMPSQQVEAYLADKSFMHVLVPRQQRKMKACHEQTYGHVYVLCNKLQQLTFGDEVRAMDEIQQCTCAYVPYQETFTAFDTVCSTHFTIQCTCTCTYTCAYSV